MMLSIMTSREATLMLNSVHRSACQQPAQAPGITVSSTPPRQSLQLHLPWLMMQSRSISPNHIIRKQPVTNKQQNSTKASNPHLPWLMMQSRSISPNRRPPSRARPSTGCLVRICVGPLLREWILKSTMCFSRW
jgi:hypothetical protein